MGKKPETSFENFYDKFDQTEFEEPWKRTIKSKNRAMKISLIISGVLNTIETFFFTKDFIDLAENSIFQFMLCLLLICFNTDIFVIFFSYIFRSKKNDVKYSEMYKRSLIGGMLNNFYSDVNYQPFSGISKNIYDSGLYREYYNKYYSDDFAEMMFKEKYSVRLAEVYTAFEDTNIDSDGHTHTTIATKFYGLFAQIFLTKSIGCNLRIRQNQLFKQYNEIEMDYAEFEKMFDGCF